MGPTEKLFSAIVHGDREEVKKIVSADGFDINRRDHVGRTPLQIAILAKEVDIACDLIDAGARMTSRLVDGRTALHLAAQLDLPTLLRKLLERSAINAEKAAAEATKKAQEEVEDRMEVDDEAGAADEDGEKDGDGDDGDEERDSSEDDWSSEGEGEKKKDQDTKQDMGQIPEDNKDEPDVFNVDLPDWDYALTPIQYAVIFGSLGAVDELIAGGADATLVTTKGEGWTKRSFHPLTLTALTEDVGIATEMVKKLVAAGATSSPADEDLFTIFHKIVCVRKPELVEALLRYDASAKAVIDSPHVSNNVQMTLPIVSAIASNQLATIAILLAYGTKLTFTEEEYSRALELRLARAAHVSPWIWLTDIMQEEYRTYQRMDTGSIRLAASNLLAGGDRHQPVHRCDRTARPSRRGFQHPDRVRREHGDTLAQDHYRRRPLDAGHCQERREHTEAVG